MSSSSLSLTKAKDIAINFIKKYKDSLRDCRTHQLITDADIARYEALTPSDFFDIGTVQANFGSYFSPFEHIYQRKVNKPLIWMGKHSNIDDLMKKITKNSESYEDLLNYWQFEGCWYNFTEARMKALEKIFDQHGAKSKTAKKSGKKTAKTTAKPKSNVIKVSDVVTIKNDVAFIDSEDKKFDHLMPLGGMNIDTYVASKSELNASNQIDHVIYAFKVAKKELDTFISELVKAKEAGAKNVVDLSWCSVKDFDFNY